MPARCGRNNSNPTSIYQGFATNGIIERAIVVSALFFYIGQEYLAGQAFQPDIRARSKARKPDLDSELNTILTDHDPAGRDRRPADLPDRNCDPGLRRVLAHGHRDPGDDHDHDHDPCRSG